MSETNDEVQWLESLPEQLRDAPYFKPPEDGSHRTVEQVIADLNNAASMQGNLTDSHVKIPPPDAAPEDIQAFRDRVLKIDNTLVTKPEDYSPVPENADGYEAVEGVDPSIREMALANKWSQAQYKAYTDHLTGQQTAATEQQAQWKADQANVLSEKLGAAKADHIARTVGVVNDVSPDLATAIMEGTVDANIVMALDTLVHKMIDMGGEAGEFNQQAGAGARGFTPDEAQSKATEIRTRLTTERLPYKEQERLKSQLVEYQKLARTG